MVLLRGRGMMFKEFENGIFSLPSHDYFEQLEQSEQSERLS